MSSVQQPESASAEPAVGTARVKRGMAEMLKGGVIMDVVTADQAKIAEDLGYNCWWSVEHHGAGEFSLSSTPEMFNVALAMSTKRLRIGHSGVLTPFQINHPLRVAERAAFVDLLSDGTTSIEFPAPRHDTAHTHGSGDTLAAAITSGLARGLSMPDAVAEGKRFVTAAVQGSFPLGAGLGPVGHFWRIRDWPE